MTVWLSDLELFAQFNDAYRSHFSSDFPSRSTVEAKLAMGVDVEIEVQAWLGAAAVHGGYTPGPVSEA